MDSDRTLMKDRILVIWGYPSGFTKLPLCPKSTPLGASFTLWFTPLPVLVLVLESPLPAAYLKKSSPFSCVSLTPWFQNAPSRPKPIHEIPGRSIFLNSH